MVLYYKAYHASLNSIGAIIVMIVW